MSFDNYPQNDFDPQNFYVQEPCFNNYSSTIEYCEETFENVYYEPNPLQNYEESGGDESLKEDNEIYSSSGNPTPSCEPLNVENCSMASLDDDFFELRAFKIKMEQL